MDGWINTLTEPLVVMTLYPIILFYVLVAVSYHLEDKERKQWLENKEKH